MLISVQPSPFLIYSFKLFFLSEKKKKKKKVLHWRKVFLCPEQMRLFLFTFFKEYTWHNIKIAFLIQSLKSGYPAKMGVWIIKVLKVKAIREKEKLWTLSNNKHSYEQRNFFVRLSVCARAHMHMCNKNCSKISSRVQYWLHISINF